MSTQTHGIPPATTINDDAVKETKEVDDIKEDADDNLVDNGNADGCSVTGIVNVRVVAVDYKCLLRTKSQKKISK
jgi:uncharacterized protein YqkB